MSKSTDLFAFFKKICSKISINPPHILILHIFKMILEILHDKIILFKHIFIESI